MAEIHTVLGGISPDGLGFCQSHEHLMLRMGPSYRLNHDLLLDSVEKSLSEVLSYREAGGDTLIDAQPGGCGRMPAELREISEASGVNIIAVSGFHKLCYYDKGHWIHGCAPGRLEKLFAGEALEGMFLGLEGECELCRTDMRAGVLKGALEAVRGQPFDEVAETIKRTAFRITRVGQLVAREASRRLNVPFGIVDLSLAPTPSVGDSVAAILEEMGLESCGTHGTTAALALLNDAVKKGGVMASSHVGGLSGAFIPVSEDIGMIQAAEKGVLSLEKLEAMTCVCSVGLDMIAIPGDTPAETIAAIIADEAAIGMVNGKTTAVRVIPAPGTQTGDRVEFGGLLGHAPVIPVRPQSAADFIHRGGRIPAPLHSLRN